MNGLLASGTSITPQDPFPNWDDSAVKAVLHQQHPGFQGDNYKAFTIKNPTGMVHNLVKVASTLRTKMPADDIRLQAWKFLGNWSHSWYPFADQFNRQSRQVVHAKMWDALLPLINNALVIPQSVSLAMTQPVAQQVSPYAAIQVAHRVLPTTTGTTIPGATHIAPDPKDIPSGPKGQVLQDGMIDPSLYDTGYEPLPTKSGYDKESLYIIGAVALVAIGGAILFFRK